MLSRPLLFVKGFFFFFFIFIGILFAVNNNQLVELNFIFFKLPIMNSGVLFLLTLICGFVLGLIASTFFVVIKTYQAKSPLLHKNR